MGSIKRTYPTPDTNRPNCGPRERAMAVFKYLLGLEPSEAIRHPRFDLIVHAFEQQSRSATGEALRDPLCEELTSEQEVDLPPLDKL